MILGLVGTGMLGGAAAAGLALAWGDGWLAALAAYAGTGTGLALLAALGLGLRAAVRPAAAPARMRLSAGH